jgi:hypothetical protein
MAPEGEKFDNFDNLRDVGPGVIIQDDVRFFAAAEHDSERSGWRRDNGITWSGFKEFQKEGPVTQPVRARVGGTEHYPMVVDKDGKVWMRQ